MENITETRDAGAADNKFKSRGIIVEPLQIGSFRRPKRRGLPPLRERSPPWSFDPITGDIVKPAPIVQPRSHTEPSAHKLVSSPPTETRGAALGPLETAAEACSSAVRSEHAGGGAKWRPSSPVSPGGQPSGQPTPSSPLQRAQILPSKAVPKQSELSARECHGTDPFSAERTVGAMAAFQQQASSEPAIRTPGENTGRSAPVFGTRVSRGRARQRLLTPGQPGAGLAPRTRATLDSPVKVSLPSTQETCAGQNDAVVGERDAAHLSSLERPGREVAYYTPQMGGVRMYLAALADIGIDGRTRKRIEGREVKPSRLPPLYPGAASDWW
ncbi:hypothetical protein HPB50_023430 [Hyalomma asiaticum]|uniref:Uncharacterized protein n=1 Tax=Hyalomma asiaticum TaxID=266040 RepID=A0ACB7TSF1_HYAAI|nr:hypothetical protein HPB50_023430 [Hyalomma asiaticum]